MHIIVLYAGLEDREQNWPDDCSLALQRVAGSNVLGHVINQLRGAHADKLTLVVQRDADAILAWCMQELPGLDVDLVKIESAVTPLEALAASRGTFDRGSLLVALGSHIVEADYNDLEQNMAGLTLFVNPEDDVAGDGRPQDAFTWAGVCCFLHGITLAAALDRAMAAGQTDLASLLDDLVNADPAAEIRPATLSLDAGTIEGLLYANARLLGLGYGSEDAIERSYVEDFTVIPPVFLHETAVIEYSVIGPFTNVEAGATISSSVVRNTLLGRDSAVENVVLDGSIIGSHARVEGAGVALIVEEEKNVTP